MRRVAFLFLCLVVMVSLSMACGGGSSTPATTTGSVTTTAPGTSAPPTSTPPPQALNLFWTEPSKPVAVANDSELYLNFRGQATNDPTAVITVGVDDDTDMNNGGIVWFERTYRNGYFLVTVDIRDYAPGTHFFVARITRGAEVVTKYLEHPLVVSTNPSLLLNTPSADSIIAWDSNFNFTGTNVQNAEVIRLLLDTDRNPTNGFAAIVANILPGNNFVLDWQVPSAYSGRFYPMINLRANGSDEYVYAPGSLLIGDMPAVNFTAPMNQTYVRPMPQAVINIVGNAYSAAADPVFNIGYDTDLDPNNGGITWLYQDLPIGDFSYDWSADIVAGGTYYIVGQVTDEFGTATGYAPGPIEVDGRNYIEFYEPLTDMVIGFGYSSPIFINGYGWTAQGNATITVFYDDDKNIMNGTSILYGPSAEGPFNLIMDVSAFDTGLYYIGATLQVGFTTTTVWAPMSILIIPDPDITSPFNTGPHYAFNDAQVEVRDPARNNKRVYYELYYPTNAVGETEIASSGPFPVVIFMPENYVSCSSYSKLLKRWAKWGFVVVGINTWYNQGQQEVTRARIDAEDAIFLYDYIMTESVTQGSKFFGKVDMTKVCVSGNGRGGGAAIIAADTDERFKSVMGLAPARYQTTDSLNYIADKPIYIIAGSASTNRPIQGTNGVQTVYNLQNPPKIFAILEGGNNKRFRDSIVGWEQDGSPTMSLADQQKKSQGMTVAWLCASLLDQDYYMAWINGAQVPNIGSVNVQSMME